MRLLAFEVRERLHPLGLFSAAELALGEGVLLVERSRAIVQVGSAQMGRRGPLVCDVRALACRAYTCRRFLAVVRNVAAFLRVAKKLTRLTHGQESPLGATVVNVEPGSLRGRFARWALAGDWRVWLAVCWTVLVAGVLIIWEVYVALSSDNGYVSNGDLEVFSFFAAAAVWLFGVFCVGLIAIAAFLVKLTRKRVASAQTPPRET